MDSNKSAAALCYKTQKPNFDNLDFFLTKLPKPIPAYRIAKAKNRMQESKSTIKWPLKVRISQS